MTLHLFMDNFKPSSTGKYLEVDWNIENVVVPSNETVEGVIKLLVRSETVDITEFNFKKTIKGTY